MDELQKMIRLLCPYEIKYYEIGDIAEVGTGSSNRNESSTNGSFPFYVRSKNIELKDTYEFNEEAIIIPGEGGIGDIFHYVNGKYALHQRVYRIHFTTNMVNTKFAYYYMQNHWRSWK